MKTIEFLKDGRLRIICIILQFQYTCILTPMLFYRKWRSKLDASLQGLKPGGVDL